MFPIGLSETEKHSALDVLLSYNNVMILNVNVSRND